MAVSAQRRRRALIAVVAALIAAGAFYLAMEYAGKTSSTTPGGTVTTTAPPVPTATVVVASSAIPEGALLDESSLKTEAVPETDLPTVPTGTQAPYYTSLVALTQTKEYASIDIPAGTVVLSSMITTAPAAAAVPNAGIPAVLPAGYVAIALPYAPGAASGTGMGTGGFIQTGDRIDILVNNGAGTTYWAYENVLVLALGQSTGVAPASSSASPAASSSAAATTGSALVMVELPRQDAAAMATVEDSSGWTIQYLIESANDYPNPSASPVPAIGAGTGNVSVPNNFFGG